MHWKALCQLMQPMQYLYLKHRQGYCSPEEQVKEVISEQTAIVTPSSPILAYVSPAGFIWMDVAWWSLSMPRKSHCKQFSLFMCISPWRGCLFLFVPWVWSLLPLSGNICKCIISIKRHEDLSPGPRSCPGFSHFFRCHMLYSIFPSCSAAPCVLWPCGMRSCSLDVSTKSSWCELSGKLKVFW